MERLKTTLFVLCALCHLTSGLNLAPVFTADMNQHTLTENTPVGTVIYTLRATDPEGSRVFYGLEGTDLLSVDRVTGEVTVSAVIDREAMDSATSSEVRLVVVAEDEVNGGGGSSNNVVKVPVSVIVLDENDNEPEFSGAPYAASVDEDTPVGTTVFRAIEATDRDLIGEVGNDS